MTLSAGTRLGPYEVLSLLGAGGMGEVWRARDAKLNREVALKILPDALAADPERMARFEREARTLAALNHPHIAQVYGWASRPRTSKASSIAISSPPTCS
jgi:serine/threonine protein kinase